LNIQRCLLSDSICGILRSVAWTTLSATLLVAGALAQNPVPQIVWPLHPDAVAPGGGDFTLSVYGANFLPGAVVNWNYQPRTTTYVSGHELQAQILSTDIAKNTAGYISVTNPAPGGGSSSASWAQVEVHAPISTISVTSPQYYPFGFWAMAAADFTHDGILDLVGEYFGLSFDRGVGDGTFQSGPIISPLWVQLTPFVYGDFNNDGNVDVAMNVGQQPPAAVTHMGVMLGDGKGGFTRGPILTEQVGFGIAVATGDFNRDGKLDLMTTGLGVMSEFLGNGDGTFQHFANYPYWVLAWAMQVGDFNGDGKLDLILEGPAFLGYGRTIWFMEGNGDGTFQTPREILSLSSTSGCGSILQQDIQLSDFNGDGKLDLAFCANKGIGIMLGNGDGTFQPPRYYFIDPTSSGNFTFAVGDINSDGKQDLLVYEYFNSNNPLFVALLGNGDGTFQAPQTINVASTPFAELGVTVGDFNNDGSLDFIFLSDGGMDVFLQQ
jgi:hypothetical protein